MSEPSGLDPDEDVRLRRLAFLGSLGALSGPALDQFRELRGRDRRNAVRDPDAADATLDWQPLTDSDEPAENELRAAGARRSVASVPHPRGSTEAAERTDATGEAGR